jgi:hypothetical protein
LFKYRVFANTIESELELPGFPVVSSSKPDVRITRKLSDEPIPYDFHKVLAQRVREGFDCIFPNAVRYRIADGEKVIVSSCGDIRADVERIPLYGFVLAALFMQQKKLIMHASCVNVGGKAIVIAGDKFQGKSTLVAALIRRGHSLLSDDVTVLFFDSREKRMKALPGMPVLKLWPNAACAVGFDDSIRSAPLFFGTEKRRYDLSEFFCKEPLEVSNIFFLDTNSNYDMQKVHGAKKIIYANAAQYFANFSHLFTKDERSEQFTLCYQLAMCSDAYRIRRPKDFNYLSEVSRLVEEVSLV